MSAIGHFLIFCLNIYFYIIIAEVVMSWLIAFDVINVRNRQANNLMALLKRLTDPVMNPLRRYIPAIGGIDITPIIVIFGIFLLQGLIHDMFID